MFVMWKFNCELALVFRFHRVRGDVRFSKREALIFARRGAHMTDRADGWACARHRLAREELLAMTTNARIVIREISHIRKLSFGIPRRRNFVTGIAFETLVLVRRMEKR